MLPGDRKRVLFMTFAGHRHSKVLASFPGRRPPPEYSRIRGTQTLLVMYG